MGRWAIFGGALYLAVGLIGAPPKPDLTSSTSPLASDSESRSHVSRAQYGDEWPLTIDAGELLCVRPNSVIFRALDGRVYALNGPAASRYPGIEPIWARDERLSKLSGEDMRVSVGRLIAEGLALCDTSSSAESPRFIRKNACFQALDVYALVPKGRVRVPRITACLGALREAINDLA